MNVRETKLPGVLLLEPRVYRDERGFFLESFNQSRFAELTHLGLPTTVRQTNQSRSMHRVLRGLHYQLHKPQGKLVSVVRGEIFDVAVDIRVGSPTFGKWTGACLSGETPAAIWIPPGFAHGFCVLSDAADVVYACTDIYDPTDDRGLRWDDPTIGVEWPVRDPLLSPRDQQLPTLEEARGSLPELVR